MTTWGVDLGVRSAYAARVHGESVVFSTIVLKLRDHSRPDELARLLAWARDLSPADRVLIEEPPLAGRRNIRTFLHLAQVSGVVSAATGGTLVPVDTWKQGTVGKGGVSKEEVARWLLRRHPDLHAQCGGDQNLTDATCIALLGERQQPRH